MVVDIGGGTTEIAIISLGGIVTAKSIRIGGDEFDESIVSYVKKTYNLAIGERTAEDVKISIGSTFKDDQEQNMQIRGRDLISGLPKTIEISSAEVRDALNEPINSIVDASNANCRSSSFCFRKNTTRVSIRYNGKRNNVNWRGSIT